MKRLALWEDPFGLSPVEPETAGMLRMSKPVLRKLEGPVLRKLEGPVLSKAEACAEPCRSRPPRSPFDALRVSG
jgi:hypothetical protein